MIIGVGLNHIFVFVGNPVSIVEEDEERDKEANPYHHLNAS